MTPKRAGSDSMNLGNWRTHPISQHSFQNVENLISVATIDSGNSDNALNSDLRNLDHLEFASPDGQCNLEGLLKQGYTDGFCILHKEKFIAEWHAPHFSPSIPHIVFSVSKSLTAMLAGILEINGWIDCEAPVAEYIPETKSGVYGGCTLRHLLDMTVALKFEENYTDKNSEYILYRKATAWNPLDSGEEDPGLEKFLYGLSKSSEEHGDAFLYRSPNSDLLGLVLERSAGKPLAELFSQYLWKPMGANQDGYITLDNYGAPRAAGGICITLHDLARIGLLFLNNGFANNTQIVSEKWIEDTRFNGDQSAWNKGNYHYKLPYYKYRNSWYQVGNEDGVICARGIHGQILYINPARSVVIVRLSSHTDPLNEPMTSAMMTAFDQISQAL